MPGFGLIRVRPFEAGGWCCVPRSSSSGRESGASGSRTIEGGPSDPLSPASGRGRGAIGMRIGVWTGVCAEEINGTSAIDNSRTGGVHANT